MVDVSNGSDCQPNWTVACSRESAGAMYLAKLWRYRLQEFVKERTNEKELIQLCVGDPTAFGNLTPHPTVAVAIKKAADSGIYNGYKDTVGIPSLRQTVADVYSRINEAPLTMKDVIITSACSGALEIAIGTLSNAGQNILSPSPGFTLYRCLLGAKQVEQRLYKTLPERQWEVDIDDLERLVDENTAAIIVNNPSNPCGSVYSKAHLKDIANFAARHRIPIISDEIYAEIVFSGHTFHSIASVATDVPVLVCGGMSKRYLIPGWRIGWILIHDPIKAFDREVRSALNRMTMKIGGSSTVVQAAASDIINNVPDSFLQQSIVVFEENARLVYGKLQSAPGLTPVMPSGAMYMMVSIDIGRFPEFDNEFEFLKSLVIEQSLVCTPGEGFHYPNSFRVVLVMPKNMMSEVCDRICSFCQQHYK